MRAAGNAQATTAQQPDGTTNTRRTRSRGTTTRHHDFPVSYPLNVRANAMLLRTVRATVTEDTQALEATGLRMAKPDVDETLLLVTRVTMCAVAIQQHADTLGVLDLDSVLFAVNDSGVYDDEHLDRGRAAVLAATLSGLGSPEMAEQMPLAPARWSSTWPAIVGAVSGLLWVQADALGKPPVVACRHLVEKMPALRGAGASARASQPRPRETCCAGDRCSRWRRSAPGVVSQCVGSS